MTLYEKWEQILENQGGDSEYKEAFENYLKKETELYRQILSEKEFTLSGTLADLASRFGTDPVVFTGFLDGANTSFSEKVDLKILEETSSLSLEILPKTLYYNMLMAKANWLYNLAEWDGILSEDEKRDIRLRFNRDVRATSDKIGRNDPCPCGSGKKYKKCCLLSMQ